MMDDSDKATQQEELLRDIALKSYRKHELPNLGVCHNCSEPCRGCFCSRECAEDYEMRDKFNKGKI